MKDLENLKEISSFEVLEKAREQGFVIGGVVIYSQGLIKLCQKYGVYPDKVLRFLQPL